MRRRATEWTAVVGVAISLGSLAGCAAGPVPVEGAVTLDGQPVAGAHVTFILDGADGEAPAAETGATGAFRLYAPPGNYKVVVVKKEIGPNMMKSVLPERYADFGATPLAATVPTARPLELRLTGK